VVATAVLASGEGTILEAIAARTGVDVVVADRPCRALDVAERAHVAAVLADRADHGGFSSRFDREGYTRALVGVLDQSSVDLVCMAGFGTILAPLFFDHFGGRVLNTHPSLLPAFRGWHAVRDALAAGATTTGCTVHVATSALDDGPILCQEAVDVLDDDDEASLHARIKAVERRLYPEAIVKVREAMAAGQAPSSLARPAEVGGR
jgi:phosphoribosylglycinamide formyltransferase 1